MEVLLQKPNAHLSQIKLRCAQSFLQPSLTLGPNLLHLIILALAAQSQHFPIRSSSSVLESLLAFWQAFEYLMAAGDFAMPTSILYSHSSQDLLFNSSQDLAGLR